MVMMFQMIIGSYLFCLTYIAYKLYTYIAYKLYRYYLVLFEIKGR